MIVQYLMRAARKADSAERYSDLQPFIPHMVQLESLDQNERAAIFLSCKQVGGKGWNMRDEGCA